MEIDLSLARKKAYYYHRSSVCIAIIICSEVGPYFELAVGAC
jgi:hypothetical protein